MSGANRGRLTNDDIFWTQDANTSVQVRMTPSFTAGNTEATLTMFSTDSTSNLVRIASVKDPVLAQDAATKNYVDGLIAGATSWKDTVRVATTTAGTLATDFENGDTIDGITLATGDRILIKNQASGVENGIYTVNATGAPTRAADLDTGDSAAGAATYVQEGTANAEQVFICTTTIAAGDDVGTNPLTFENLGSTFNTISAAGSNTQVQFNDGGNLAANSAFTWDYSSNTLALTTDDSEMTFGAGADMTLGSDGINGTLATTANLALTTAGLSSTIGGAGTQVSWTGGDAANGTDLALIAGNSTTATNEGGQIIIDGGDGNTTGAGGDVTITGGDGGATDASVGGTVNITGGTSTATNGDGGDVVINGGAATGTGTAGDVFLGSSGANANVRVFYNIDQADITQATQIVNKKYVDSVAQGLTWKDSARVATTASDMTGSTYATSGGDGLDTITWATNPTTIDGVNVTTGDRVLVKDDAATTGTNSQGIYEVTTDGASLVLTRTSDALGAGGPAIQASGAALFVEEGTTQADRAYVCVTDNADFGDDISFTVFSSTGSAAGPDGSVQFADSGSFANGSIVFSNGTNILTIGDEAATGTVQGIDATTAATAGGTLALAGGDGNTTGAGGAVNIDGGNGGDATANGGDINITSGDGGATSGTSGNVVISASTTGNTNGDVRIQTSGVQYEFNGAIIESNAAVDIRGAATSTFDLATTTTTGVISLGPASIAGIELGSAADASFVSVNGTGDSTSPSTGALRVDGGVGVAENVYSSANFGFWSGTGTTAVNMVHNGTDSLLDSRAGDLRLEVTDTTAGSHIRMNTADQTIAGASVPAKETGTLLEVEQQVVTISGGATTVTDTAAVSIAAPNYVKSGVGLVTLTDVTTMYVAEPISSPATNITLGASWSIWAEGDIRANAFEATSDVKFKENIEPLQLDNSPLQKLMEIEGYQYDWKPEFSSNRKKQWGVLAQQLESVGLNNVVSGTDRKSVNYLALIPLLIEAVKELAGATVEFE